MPTPRARRSGGAGQEAREGMFTGSGAPKRPGAVSEGLKTLLKPSGARKYGNVPTDVDGKRFASKREAARYVLLRAMERAGEITDLETQVLYRFEVKGVKVGRYTADFRYLDAWTGETVVEDAKGTRVRDWYRTKRLMLACHGITVREV
jgi:hypothetical protein